MVNPRNGAINDFFDAARPQKRVELLEKFDDIGNGDVEIHDESAVGQSEVRAEHVAYEMGWQQRVEPAVSVEQ